MTSNKIHSVSIKRDYIAGAETLFNLFKDGMVFKLTQADDVQSDFKPGGEFRLTFNNRGFIYGRFIKISNNHIIMEWNVEGFKREKEISTYVEISLINDREKCILTLHHKNILNSDAAKAKLRAWTEILNEIEYLIHQDH